MRSDTPMFPKQLSGTYTPAPFREHNLWQVRGHTPSGLHYNRAFRRKSEAMQFLRAMQRDDFTKFTRY